MMKMTKTTVSMVLSVVMRSRKCLSFRSTWFHLWVS